jgi:hypothetical protein
LRRGHSTAAHVECDISCCAGHHLCSRGLYVGIEETIEDSLAAELLPHQLRGTGFGAMAVVNGIGDFISSIAVGWLWMAYGPTAGFAFAFALMATGSVFMWRIRRNHA